jgi:hypothetical protein
MDRPNTNKGTGAGVYRWRPKQAHSFSFGFHTTLFHAEIRAIKAQVMEYVEKGYTGRNIDILTVSR